MPNDIHAFLDSSGKAVRKKGDRENGRSGGWKKKENREREEGRKGEREKGKRGRWEREERKREQGRAGKAENEAASSALPASANVATAVGAAGVYRSVA